MGVWFLALLGAVTPLADRFQACNARAARIEPAAMDCLSEMADEAARVGDAGIEAKARYSISWLEMWLADFQRGAREGERAHELFRKLPDGFESRFCGATLGYRLRELGEPRRSLALIGESIERTHAAHDQWRESFARSFRARTLLWMGEFEEAEAEARRSLEIAQAVGEPLAIAVANWPLGVALQEQGRPREAIPTQEAGAAAAMKSGMPQFAFVMRLNIAQMSLEVDDTVRVPSKSLWRWSAMWRRRASRG